MKSRTCELLNLVFEVRVASINVISDQGVQHLCYSSCIQGFCMDTRVTNAGIQSISTKHSIVTAEIMAPTGVVDDEL